MKKNLLSLFSGCGGMDIGFEGGFKILKSTINTDCHKAWIEKEEDIYVHLKETFFETKFANDIRMQRSLGTIIFRQKEDVM